MRALRNRPRGTTKTITRILLSSVFTLLAREVPAFSQETPTQDTPQTQNSPATQDTPQTPSPEGSPPDPTERASEASEDRAEEIDTVLVIGSRFGATGTLDRGVLAGAYDVTARYELQDEHPNETLELFNKIPGVSLSRYNQGVINTDAAIRGFAGDGTTPHAKLLIDGIPSHLHNGYGELDQLFPMGIETIEVFKGTSDVRYGRYNTAGNYYVTSRSDEATEVQATYGSFDAFEGQAYSGLKINGLTQSLFAGYRRTDGFRDHGQTSKYSISGRWSLELNERASLAFMTRFSGYEGDASGYLSREDARAAPTSSGSFADQDGGEKEIQHFSLHFTQGFLGDALQLSAKVYRQSFERQRWVRFREVSSLQDRFDDQLQTGLITTLAWMPLEDWSFTLGFDIQGEDVIEQRFGTVGQTRLRDVNNVMRNYDYALRTYGGFASIDHTLFDRLRWSVGLRVDHFDGDFSAIDAAGNKTTAEIIDFGFIFQPKVNVLASIFDGLILFANYGRSFQSPFGASLYAVEGEARSPEVSINDGWEVGAKLTPGLGLGLRLSYWQQLASNEFVSVDGVDRNVGETDRSGIEAALTWYLLDSLYLWGNISWNIHEISNPGDTMRETIGNRLRSIPDFTTSFGARYDITQNIFAAAHVDGQGGYYVNERNQGGRFGDYLLAQVQVGFQTETDRLQLQVNNAFDAFYEYVFDFGNDGAATIHSPGAGVNVNLSYTRRFR